MADGEFKPVKYAQIVAALRRGIADGTYPPGTQLPSETQLVEQFGVSRPTVVRALEQLKLSGEIDREHGRGSFVKEDAPSAVSGPVQPVDPVGLAETLRETAANLEAFIERRAQEIAADRIAELEKKIEDLTKEITNG